jgi:hypothetical protein
MVAALHLRAQVEEPILAKSAIPFGPGAGSMKIDYAGGIGQGGGNSQVIPEVTLELGIAAPLEVLARFPLLRVNVPSQHDTVIGGGQLAIGARYLLIGDAARRYAVSVQVIAEVPTGDTLLVGNATQVMPTILGRWRLASRLVAYSNLTFDHSIGGFGPSPDFLEYANAIAWKAAVHFVPAFEVVGSTSLHTGRTEMVALPEMIFRAGTHLEAKAGLQVGLNAETPDFGLRAQFAWSWGKRK